MVDLAAEAAEKIHAALTVAGVDVLSPHRARKPLFPGFSKAKAALDKHIASSGKKKSGNPRC
jgi:hypothetical protein